MKTQRWSSPWLFCVVTFVFTWLCWVPMTLPGSQPNMLLMLLGAAAPGVTGILLTTLLQPGPARREFWHRILSRRRCTFRWAVLILLGYPVMIGMSFLITWLVSGSRPSFPYAAQTLASFTGALGFIVTEILGGPVIEEPGWRGYLLPRWQDRHGPVAASLMVGIVWAVWHLPLFFIPGTIQQQEMGFATPAYALWLLDMLAWSCLLTFLFNRTGQSVLAVMLLHFSHNFTYTIAQVAVSPANTYYTLIELVVALAIVLRWVAAGQSRELRSVEPTS